MLTATGLDLITDANLLKEAKAEFEKQRASTPYKTLNDVATSPAGKLSDSVSVRVGLRRNIPKTV